MKIKSRPTLLFPINFTHLSKLIGVGGDTYFLLSFLHIINIYIPRPEATLRGDTMSP